MISESYGEIQAGDAYYDLDIKRIKTMCFVETRRDGEENAREAWMAGWFFDPTVQAKLDSDEWCKANGDAELAFRVEDNGADGDGLRLDIDVIDGSVDGPGELASVKLSPRHAAALANALLCAVKMRVRRVHGAGRVPW